MGNAMYFFLSSDGDIIAYTNIKDIAKLYKNQRKTKYVKISAKKLKKMNLHLELNMELYIAYNIAITDDEFDYFSAAWNQYIIESTMDMEEFLSDLMVYKFTDKEKEKIKPLVRVLTTYRHQLKHGIIDECEDMDYFYNKHNALLYFVNHVL